VDFWDVAAIARAEDIGDAFEFSRLPVPHRDGGFWVLPDLCRGFTRDRAMPLSLTPA